MQQLSYVFLIFHWILQPPFQPVRPLFVPSTDPFSHSAKHEAVQQVRGALPLNCQTRVVVRPGIEARLLEGGQHYGKSAC